MSKPTHPYDPNELSKIYGKLNSQDVEQFYSGYQLWHLQQRALSLKAQIEDLRQEIAANAERMAMVHPPAIALAAMARLQASGVKDIALLDRMLERGEEWLDRTMQRLDYCEQLDFINDDYTQWCQNALEGAYDWIDSMREGGASPSSQAPTSEATGEATEELLLQKLTSEEDEQTLLPETARSEAESAKLEESASVSEEPTAIIEESPTGIETPPDLEETKLELQEEQPSQLSQSVEANAVSEPLSETSPASDISTEQTVEEETSSSHDTLINPAPIDAPPAELSPTSDSQPSTGEASENEQATSQGDSEFDPATEEPPHPQPYIDADQLEDTEQGNTQDIMPPRHHNFLQRLAAKIWAR